AGILQVNTPGYLYVNNVVPNISGTALINNLIIYITSQGSGTLCEFQILSGGSVSSVPSNTCSLNTGTYYINIYASPNTPVSSAGPETVTINFGYNVIGNEAVSVPS
ncbi:hypothetical protein, partial [Caldivirga sp. UBA161]|uniref:hypothetical protein n=1 Tax=Caldivirga sp. UBA161 TaxID=1915569 RepID=UPI0025B99F95